MTTTTEISITSSKAAKVAYILSERKAGKSDDEIRAAVARATRAGFSALKGLFEMADDPTELAKWEAACEWHRESKASGRKPMTAKNLRRQTSQARQDRGVHGWTCRCGGSTSIYGQLCGEC
jgi:hypothetical protein